MSKNLSFVLGVAVLGSLALPLLIQTDVDAQGCGVGINPIVCENQKPGDPAGEWDISGSGDGTIQGFATQFSIAPGQVQQFKIETDSTNYQLVIYRMGFYGGQGARRVATVNPSAALPQSQPGCLTQSATGLIDCGNWAVSASWTVPPDAVSGIYFAKANRLDTGGASHIFFVVRDDTRRADILFQTSDTTWQAYNSWGGNSLYVGAPAGRAYKVSYNRPFNTRDTTSQDFVFNAEYPMVRWLEANGFDVSYASGIDTDRFGSELLEHKVFLSVGHDEYWSGQQRANVEAARAAGVHLGFFSGNTMFWKTRWESSIDGSSTPHRTLVTYKETHANAVIDPATPIWTGTWRDPRFSPPGDGGRPENAVMGTSFRVNAGTTTISVPAENGKLRFWRNTSIANLAPGATATLPDGTLGYEWDEAPDDAFTPPRMMRLSLSTRSSPSILLDYGSTYGAGSATHSLTLYRHASGALVFGAGTIQWSWGLDSNHDRGSAAPDSRMKQATVNLLADMQVLPQTLEAGLTAATPSTDTNPPTSVITAPAPGTSVVAGTAVTISGTATENGGGIVGGVEVSVDGGATWMRANGTTSWTMTWTTSTSGNVTIQSRAFDDTGNIEVPSGGVGMTVTGGGGCPCTIWSPTSVPPAADDGDASAVELGTRFRADVDGYITGVRFYKAAANTGTHTGRLWTNTGTLLGTVTFTNETASGWQQANFASAIPISANTTYIVSYHTPTGHYTGTDQFFSNALDNPPLHGLRDGVDGANGVYRYGLGGMFPTDTYFGEGYWVDAVFNTVGPPDSTPPTVSAVTPAHGSGNVDPATLVTVTFNEPMSAATINASTIQLRDSANTLVPATVTYDAPTRRATLRPDAPLALAATFTATARGGASDPRVKDLAGNALAATYTWTFTTAVSPPPPGGCPCSIWTPTTVPAIVDDGDPNSVELGTRFRSDVAGSVTGARFYKSAANTGTHVAKLWTNTGTLLGSVTFSSETASGWQQATFATPIAIAADTTYVISYHANNGHYSAERQLYATAGVDNGLLHALRDGVDGSNGVYLYGASAFPTQTYNSEGYFVDVVFVNTSGPDTTAPLVAGVTPLANASGVGTNTSVTVTFNEAMDAASISSSTFALRDASAAIVPATVSYSAGTRTATLVPTSALAYSSQYTATVVGGTSGPRVTDVAGNALATNYSWTFTTAAPPPPAPIEGTGGPILLITSNANPFTTYMAEILRAEGFNAFERADVSSVTSAMLAAHDIVILGDTPVTAGVVSLLTSYVSSGGNLIAMRPDKQLASLFGLVDQGATLSEGYMRVNTATAPGTGIVGETMQFHGIADRYTVSGAQTIATLYSTASAATTNPAVTLRIAGESGATTVAFTYDLARSVIYTRQGNPAWSNQERDGLAPIRSDDLFYGAKTGDVQPDYVDLNKVAIPQADEQQRLLANILLYINLARRPLPRFWYFPRMLKAVVVMTGDDHANGGTAGRFDQYLSMSPAGCSVADWSCIRGTSYLYPNTPLTSTQVSNYIAQGFELALHVNTNCANATQAQLATFYSTQLAQFAGSYPQVPAPATNRTHCIAWGDYDSQPQVAFSNGIRLDTTYYWWPGSWTQDRPGLFTGSGMPMRFATANGTMLDVYQATTQMPDESGLQNEPSPSYPLHVNTLLDRAIGAEGYYGAFVANMHTDFNPSPGSQGSDAILASAQARGVPVISARQLLEWLDGRNGSSFQSILWSWSTNELQFDIAVGAGANGLYAMVPGTTQGGVPIATISLNNVTIPHTVETIKGRTYAVFAATGGHYSARYGTPVPVISISDASVTEGNTGQSNVAAFLVTLSAASSNTVTVQYTAGTGAASASDFNLSSGTLTFAPGETSKTANITTIGDDTLEPNETFDMFLSSPTNAVIGDGYAVGTIVNDEPVPSLSISDGSITEGNSGVVNASFTLTLSAPSPVPATVNYATANQTAIAGSDYSAASGTVTFPAGTTTQSVLVSVLGDTTNEANEVFVVNLTSPGNATIADSQGAMMILNDDAVPSLTIADVSIGEGNTGTTSATMTVTLSAASGQQVTVNYATVNGTATAGTDYQAASGTLTFAPGVTSQTFTVSVTGDTTDEPNETVLANLSAPANATIADAQGVLTITNDDGLSAALIAAYGFGEGSGTTVQDSSGRGHSGTISGAAWSTQGKNGNALSFDGVNDLVTIADAAALSVTRITMMAWVRPTSVGDWSTVLMKEGTNMLSYGMYASEQVARPSMWVHIGANDKWSEGTTALAVNTWTHLAATYDGANLRLYVNGVLVRTRAATGNITATSGALRIGGNTIWGEWFAGLIDDVRIYNRALTLAEIQSDMARAVTP